jgi:hypothetical protein
VRTARFRRISAIASASTGTSRVRTATLPCAYGCPAARPWPPCRARMTTLPCAYGSPAVRVWRPSRMRMAALPYARGKPPVCARQPCRTRMATLPCAYGGPAVCAWRPSHMRMARLPCDGLIFRSSHGFSGRNYLPGVTERASTVSFDDTIGRERGRGLEKRRSAEG